MNILSEILESLSKQKFRTAMTGFAVAWGIFILIVLLGASNGLDNGINAQYGSRANNCMEIWGKWRSKPWKGLSKDQRLWFTQREADLISKMPEIDKFSCVMNYKWRFVRYKSDEANMQVRGVEGAYKDIMKIHVFNGRFINDLDIHEYAKVVVVDEKALSELAADSTIVGNYLYIQEIPFLVIGVCKTANNWGGSAVYIPLATHQKIFSPDKRFDKICFTMHHVNDSTEQRLFEERIRTKLAGTMQFDPTDERAIGMWTQQESNESHAQAMGGIRTFILIIALCTLLSGAVGVSNIMLVSVSERTKEIGIRKALGAPPINILAMIVGEALLIMIIFGFIGMFAGIGLVELVNMLIPPTNEGAGAIFRNPTVDMGAVSIALAILTIIGTVAGFMPAWKAIKIKPIEAMNAGK